MFASVMESVAHLSRQLVRIGQSRSMVLSRMYTESPTDTASQGEEQLTGILKAKFPGATYVKVTDMSGGCGAMYEVQIQAEEFRGKRTVMQHRMVNDALKEEIKDMHGLRVSTAVPDS